MCKIFLLMDDPRINTGYAYTCRTTIDQFKKLGYECFGFTFNGGEQGGEYNGVKIIEHPKFGNSMNESLYGSPSFLIEQYNKYKPDILFFHNDFYRQAWILNLPLEIQKKSIWWLPLDMVRDDAELDFSFLNELYNLYFVSQNAADITRVKYKKVIPHAIHKSYYELEKSLRKNEDIFTVCRTDRHQPRKQWPYALDAFSIFAKNKNVRFLAKCNPADSHGLDPDTKGFINLRDFCKDYSIENKVIFFDKFQKTEDMVSDIYDQSDVFLTTTGSEGFGLGVVEAMSRGCVPVFPNGSSLPEIVLDNGYRYDYAEVRKCPDLWAEYGRPDVKVVANHLENAYLDWKLNKKKFREKTENCIKRSLNYLPSRIYGIWDEEIKNIMNGRYIPDLIFNSTEKEKPKQSEDKYSIVIVSKDKFDMLKNCLDSIVEKTKNKYEIIVVENCGSIDTYNKIVEYSHGKDIKVIRNTIEGGFTYANNLGIKESSGDYVVLLNNDTIIESENWLNETRRQLDERNAELIGPSICWFSMAGDIDSIPEPLQKFCYHDRNVGSFCCVFTGFWFVMAKRSLFLDNPLNENIKSYIADDVDYCLRMNSLGKKWTALEGAHNDGKGLVRHLQEQSRGVLSKDYVEKGMREFFDSWTDLKKEDNKINDFRVTITIPTRNREIHLNRLLTSLISQSFKDWDLVICNDGDFFSKDTGEILAFIAREGHEVNVITGVKKGPAYSHDLMRMASKNKWIFRIDDDNIVDKDCLSNLVFKLKSLGPENVGAIAPMVFSPFGNVGTIEKPNVTISDFLSAACAQQNRWLGSETTIKAEHLHSCFLYDRDKAENVGGFVYSKDMQSIVSYGEETIFTYKLYLKGYDLYILNSAMTWHFISPFGGTRDNDSYFNSREKDFQIYKDTIDSLRKIYK